MTCKKCDGSFREIPLYPDETLDRKLRCVSCGREVWISAVGESHGMYSPPGGKL